MKIHVQGAGVEDIAEIDLETLAVLDSIKKRYFKYMVMCRDQNAG